MDAERGPRPRGEPRSGCLGFLRENMIWWLVPIVLLLVLVVLLLCFGAGESSPFDYNLF